MRRSFALPLIFAALLPLAAHAQPVVQSQEGIALENQILQLQQQVQQLQASSGGGGSALGNASAPPAQTSAPAAAAPDPSVVTNLLTQVGQLQSQVQQLNGEVDTLQNQVNTQNAQTQKEIGDLKFQMGNGAAPAAAGGAPPAAQTPPAAYIAPPAPHESAPAQTHAEVTPPAHATPHTLLHDAEEAYYKRDYSVAEADAHTILSGHGGSPEAYKAQYLLAEALAGEGRAQDAAIAYDDAYNRNRTGAEAAPSLLGLANALADINQDEAACDTLSSLNSQFPKPPDGLGARISAVSHKAHCT
jgi:TolA-binding protein